jgi:hypothetical protein
MHRPAVLAEGTCAGEFRQAKEHCGETALSPGDAWQGIAAVEHIFDQPEGEQPPRKPARSGPSRAAFDLWLHHRLHDIYDSVVAEPLPAELLRMIEDARPPRAPSAELRAAEPRLEPV